QRAPHQHARAVRQGHPELRRAAAGLEQGRRPGRLVVHRPVLLAGRLERHGRQHEVPKRDAAKVRGVEEEGSPQRHKGHKEDTENNMNKSLFGLLVLSSLSPLCLCGEPSSPLEARLAPLAKAHQGKVAIAVKHLGTGETYTLNADEPLPTASLIKFPVMVETY